MGFQCKRYLLHDTQHSKLKWRMKKERKKREMGSPSSRLILYFLLCFSISSASSSEILTEAHNLNDESSYDFKSNVDKNFEGQVIEVKSEPKDVVWVVQLSDLHFSVHHPERALDFKAIVGPTLAMIKPSLVLVTGDLTDGKSKDLLTTKQDEEEWIEYKKVMEDVVAKSGLNKSIFYDLRGNHDNFGVPSFGSLSDFFSRYSLNGQLNRRGQVNSVVIETGERKLLFVGFDSTTSTGLCGPTNLFGHPTDELLSQLSSALSQWDSPSAMPITKVSFGHFPLSFSAATSSGKTLKDIFLTHSLSAYLCGHLHTKFGQNLKRHHESSDHFHKLYQLNAIGIPSERDNSCSEGVTTSKEFWEWEMGDWRKSRAMRILAIDRGYMSFVDIDFKFGAKRTILLPTFPLDSRFATSFQKHECLSQEPSAFETVRALVFSLSPIVSVVARIYDSRPGHLILVFDASMRKTEGTTSRGDLYSTPWNFKAFDDPYPERFLLQIEAIDNAGRSTLSELRPFSVNGFHAKLSWTWMEFLVMGCQWDSLYYPIFWSLFALILSVVLIPRVFISLTRKRYTYKHFITHKGFRNCMAWIFTELYDIPIVCYSMVGYLLYLILCPWLLGHVFPDSEERGYMTYRGWVLKNTREGGLEFVGFPDIMVVVLPHLSFVVLPAVLVIVALAAEKGMHHNYLLSVCGKKEDGNGSEDEKSRSSNPTRNKIRWIQKVLLAVSSAICWNHFKNCRALVKAYDMNPIIHFPLYSLFIPLLLAYAAYRTGRS